MTAPSVQLTCSTALAVSPEASPVGPEASVPLGVREEGSMPITRRQFLGAGAAVGASLVLAWRLRGTHSLGVYNVQDYGAAGDGVASDTAEIQAALNAAADGDVVYFPPGTYMASGLTLSTDGVTLLGAGATLKRNAGSVMLTVSGDRTRPAAVPPSGFSCTATATT